MTLDHEFGPGSDQSFYQRRERASRRIWRIGGAWAPAFVVVGLLVAATAAIAARAAVVSIAPGAAAIYGDLGMPVNPRGLTIAYVRATATPQTDGQGELLVTGEIANLCDRETPVRGLRLALRGEDGRELYVWTARPPKSQLGARERVMFHARLASPPAGVREVLVKFAEPGNKGAFTESPS
jgi:hypothetical protein